MSISPSALGTACPKLSNLMKRRGSLTSSYKYGAGGRCRSGRVIVTSVLSVTVRDPVAGCQLPAVMFLGGGAGIPRAEVRRQGRIARERSSMLPRLHCRRLDHTGDATNETLNGTIIACVGFGLFFCIAVRFLASLGVMRLLTIG